MLVSQFKKLARPLAQVSMLLFDMLPPDVSSGVTNYSLQCASALIGTGVVWQMVSNTNLTKLGRGYYGALAPYSSVSNAFYRFQYKP